MKKYNGQFEKEHEKILKKYIKQPWFEEINKIVNICDLSGDEESILQNIKDYIWFFLAKNREEEFSNATSKFINFIESYSRRKTPCFYEKSQGDTFDVSDDLLEISTGYHINMTYIKEKMNSKAFAANGLYSFGSFIGTDHLLYLAKRSMNSRGLPTFVESRKQVDFNPIMAQCAFEYFGEPVAEYYLVHDRFNPFKVILSKSFLQDNQELIHFSDLYTTNSSYVIDDSLKTYFGRLEMMKSNIMMRYKNCISNEKMQELLEKLTLQYCKQEFMKLVMGPMDCNMGNTALLLTYNDEQELPDIDISPAYDLDLSFNVSQRMSENNAMSLMETLDGKNTNIRSFIDEFKDVPGFSDFIEIFYEKIKNGNSSKEIVSKAYEKTNFRFFRENASQYIDFLDGRFEQVKNAYRECFIEGRGSEDNEFVLE